MSPSGNVDPKDVQALRRLTGAGVLDCKLALERTGGDLEAAAQLLREEGKAGAVRRAGREASDGAVSLVVDGAGAIVELRCETDFVAKSADFVNTAQELAAAVAASGESALDDRKEEVESLAAAVRENVSVGRVVRYEPTSDHVLDGYLHIQNDRGVNAVLVELEGGDQSVAHDLAMHIAFTRPEYLSRDEVPENEVEAERATLVAQARNEGRPEQRIPMIVEGRLNGWFRDRCLLEQPFVRDEKQTIEKWLGAARVVRFSQVVVGA
jgi:elongation factor Ts